MTMNRWFRTGNEQFELVVYDFLSKYFGVVGGADETCRN